MRIKSKYFCREGKQYCISGYERRERGGGRGASRPCLDLIDFEAFFAISRETKEMKEATGGHGSQEILSFFTS